MRASRLQNKRATDSIASIRSSLYTGLDAVTNLVSLVFQMKHLFSNLFFLLYLVNKNWNSPKNEDFCVLIINFTSFFLQNFQQKSLPNDILPKKKKKINVFCKIVICYLRTVLCIYYEWPLVCYFNYLIEYTKYAMRQVLQNWSRLFQVFFAHFSIHFQQLQCMNM